MGRGRGRVVAVLGVRRTSDLCTSPILTCIRMYVE